jgi:hypothetical protein
MYVADNEAGGGMPQRDLKDKEESAKTPGVDRRVLEPSPSCKKKTSRQPDKRLPRNKQTAPSTTATSITWPYSLLPQHETTPPLDSAQECSCKQNVTIP